MFFLSFNSLIPLLFASSLERTFAFVESGIGLGFILGPLIGAVLYYLVGYFFMFIIMGCLMLSIVSVLMYIKE